MDLKKCTKCSDDKPIEEFLIRSDNGRRGSHCKGCRSRAYSLSYLSDPEFFKAKSKANRDADIEASRERERSYSHRAKREALVAYSADPPFCQCCKETIVEFLTIDHINGDGKQHRAEIGRSGGRATYVWLRQNGWPPGFRVLCFNCNAAAGLYGSCPHTYASSTIAVNPADPDVLGVGGDANDQAERQRCPGCC